MREGQARILVVEDDADIRDLIGFTLQASGFETVSARDGQEALEIAHRDRPDAVVSDLMMPRLDGIGLVLALRRLDGWRDLPIMVLTAAGPSDPRVASLRELSRVVVVHKPPAWGELVQLLREMIAG